MIVKLLTHTPEPEKIIAAAARLCYSDKEISEIMDNFTDEKIEKFLNKLVSLGHESPLEHITFTFGVEGISRACSHQLVRHRIASYSVQSQRYVSEEKFASIVPPEIESCPEALKEYEIAMAEAQNHYNNIANILKEKHKKALLEQAIYVFKNGECTGKIVVEYGNPASRTTYENLNMLFGFKPDNE